jgi:hypothetical protein
VLEGTGFLDDLFRRMTGRRRDATISPEQLLAPAQPNAPPSRTPSQSDPPPPRPKLKPKPKTELEEKYDKINKANQDAYDKRLLDFFENENNLLKKHNIDFEDILDEDGNRQFFYPEKYPKKDALTGMVKFERVKPVKRGRKRVLPTKVAKPIEYENNYKENPDPTDIGEGLGLADKIDFEDIKWGSFTEQFKRFKQQHPSSRIHDLGDFANMIIANPSSYAKRTVKRARFYKNVLERRE